MQKIMYSMTDLWYLCNQVDLNMNTSQHLGYIKSCNLKREGAAEVLFQMRKIIMQAEQ